jgi:pteridine reductase
MADSSKVALVTGAARRVGRAIVQRLAEAGYDIAFTYNQSRSAAEDLCDSLMALGRRVAMIPADFTEPESAVASLAQSFRAQFDRLDALVNNASIYEPSSLHWVTLEQGRRLWAVHVETPLLLLRHFDKMLRQTRGHVINMSDLLAERPWPQYLVYSATKAALSNLTLGLARELAPDVTVNAIAPGVVEWPEDYPEEDRQKYLKRVPLGRAGTPADVADVVHFLCTQGCYITGQIIRLDGGRSIT